jgi:hypothetical protein
MRARRAIASAGVAFAAFLLYASTLLPGLDFGDTGSFQAIVGSPFISPRDGYPLYFALGRVALRLSGAEPAHVLNVLSAVEGALACGALVLIAEEISGSLAAGVGAALLFAGSYTFWSQAIIAEVYALHMLFVAMTLMALLRWHREPSLPRLCVFFALYALGFGNHLSMILLAPAYTLFLLTTSPGGWRRLFTWRVIGLAAAFAVAGSLQYAWNVRTMWLLPQAPTSVAEAAERFWFDVTKSDWRETMVMHVPRSMLADHLGMYWFDLRQQFGWPGVLLAVAGLPALAVRDWRRALLVVLVYAANALFAFGYNVGDKHVFYLPSHVAVALLAAPAVVKISARLPRPWIAAAVLGAYALARVYVDYPALDRSDDRRPSEVVSALTEGLDDTREILATDLNWQIQNGLSYYAQVTRPEVAWTRTPAVLLYAPALVADNLAIGRQVALTDRARVDVQDAYGPLLPTVRDRRVPASTLSEVVQDLPPGTRYVLCLLRPTSDLRLDWDDVSRSLRSLAAGTVIGVPDRDYTVVAGVAGRTPTALVSENAPFRSTFALEGVDTEVRMDAWLSADTIRRMGFGHVIVGRRHTLIVERGASFVAFGADGRPLRTAYAGNIFAPEARYLIVR